MKRKSLLVLIITSILLTVSGVNAFARVAQIWCDDNLPQSYNSQYYVRSALEKKGYTMEVVCNKTFGFFDVIGAVGRSTVFYFNGHGDNFGTYTSAYAANSAEIQSSNFAGATVGHYNIVYFQSCHVGETNHMANAFGISSSENEAFIGFSSTTPTSWNQTMFDKAIFDNLASGKTVNDSVWDARTRTGIINYKIYGNYKATLENGFY